MALLGNGLARLAGAEEGGLVDLLAVDRQGHGDAEVLVRHQLAQLRILGVGLVEDHAGVMSARARPEEDLVLALLLLVLLEDRVVQQVDVALLLVQLAGDGGQVERLRIGEELELDFVDVGQLVAGLVHADVVGVALEDEDLVADAVRGDPGRHARALRVVEGALLVGEQLRPGLELGVRHHLVQVFLLGVAGVELLQVLGRLEDRDTCLSP